MASFQNALKKIMKEEVWVGPPTIDSNVELAKLFTVIHDNGGIVVSTPGGHSMGVGHTIRLTNADSGALMAAATITHDPVCCGFSHIAGFSGHTPTQLLTPVLFKAFWGIFQYLSPVHIKKTAGAILTYSPGATYQSALADFFMSPEGGWDKWREFFGNYATPLVYLGLHSKGVSSGQFGKLASPGSESPWFKDPWGSGRTTSKNLAELPPPKRSIY